MMGPTEPSADSRAWAALIRQHFLALLSQGFTEAQALTMLGVMMGSAIAGSQNGGER